MPNRSTLYRQAGLEPLGGKSRRWRDLRTGETIPITRAGRSLAQLAPPAQQDDAIRARSRPDKGR